MRSRSSRGLDVTGTVMIGRPLSLGRRLLYGLERTGTERRCPVCSWHGRHFAPFGAKHKRRLDAQCPGCGSLERHRLAFLVTQELAELDFRRVLHVAPEPTLAQWLQRKAVDYLSVDLDAPAMARMDITRLALPDSSHTLVWAAHVLEHVPDDAGAMSEIHRILERGGKACIQVPIWRVTTYEDPTIRDPGARLAHFYQADHVRLYGLDIQQRFEAAGFSSTVHRAQDFGPDRLLLHGLAFASTNEVFVFTKE